LVAGFATNHVTIRVADRLVLLSLYVLLLAVVFIANGAIPQ
jgi:hypothetical protein